MDNKNRNILEIDTFNRTFNLNGNPIENCTGIVINLKAMETPEVQLTIDADEVVFYGDCNLDCLTE